MEAARPTEGREIAGADSNRLSRTGGRKMQWQFRRHTARWGSDRAAFDCARPHPHSPGHAQPISARRRVGLALEDRPRAFKVNAIGFLGLPSWPPDVLAQATEEVALPQYGSASTVTISERVSTPVFCTASLPLDM